MPRGRSADHPYQIPLKGWKDIAFRVKDEIEADRVGLIAAGIAFYGLLALFPGLAAAMAIAGLLTEPAMIVGELERLGQMLPDQAAEIIVDQASSVAGSREGGLGLAAIGGILLAIYSASKGIKSLIQGLNIAYDEEETRGFFKLTALTLGLTLFVILGLLLNLAATLVVPAVLSFVDFGPGFELFVQLVTAAVLFCLTVFALGFIYRHGPDRDTAEWQWITPGAVVACLLWAIGSVAFGFYVSNFASYNETFGTLGGVIVLLMWLWLSAYIVLFGAELDSEIEAQTRVDSTTGQPEPRGERGAVKADVLGESSA